MCGPRRATRLTAWQSRCRQRPRRTTHEAARMITTNELTKAYGGHLTVDRVSLQARPGRVTGFLGPNGTGKSTTMRMVVGLTRPTSGTATIDGRRFVDLPNAGREVGVLLDASAQHAGRTGREVLTIAARTMGLRMDRVDRMLDLVSLPAPRGSVGSATTPSGCDSGSASPQHSSVSRSRLSSMNPPTGSTLPASGGCGTCFAATQNCGGTVLLSSHLLHGIEIIADDLVVIGNGRIVAQG